MRKTMSDGNEKAECWGVHSQRRNRDLRSRPPRDVEIKVATPSQKSRKGVAGGGIRGCALWFLGSWDILFLINEHFLMINCDVIMVLMMVGS